MLEAHAGKQLVLIRYDARTHRNDDAWTFNEADLHNAKIVWARQPDDPNESRRLLEHFKDRRVWLAEPDAEPKRIVPYRSP